MGEGGKNLKTLRICPRKMNFAARSKNPDRLMCGNNKDKERKAIN